MKLNRRILTILLILPFFAFAQESGNFWHKTASKSSSEPHWNSLTEISEYKTLDLELENFKDFVIKAPFRSSHVPTSVVVDFPDANGEMKSFHLFKTHTLSPGLAAKFPSISSYVGITENKKSTLRLTITNQGIFGMILGSEGDVFINPLDASGKTYQVFRGTDAHRTALTKCLVNNTDSMVSQNKTQSKTQADDGKLRTYDVAIATTGEFSQYHITQAGVQNGTDLQKKTAVLDAIAVILTRVNGIYEREFAVSMSLVSNNDDLIFLDGAIDPFTNNDLSVLINESQSTINSIIGANNYDLGHTFCTGSGGLAQLFSVCSGNKARGVSGIINAPVGDPFAVKVVCHEMGHQFGANHAFSNSCSGNRNDPTSIEPGSGTTIMAYSGICSPNIQFPTDDYFNAVSLSEIDLNITSGTGNNCDTETFISNSEPVIGSIDSFHTIPKSTPFVLSASATDANGDALTYCWEQTDPGPAPMPPQSTSLEGPLFRSRPPSASPSRYFPAMSSIINQSNPTWEVLPSVARSMTFFLTVRDNNILGGQTAQEVVLINVANTGPFVVTSQNNSGNVYDTGSSFQVTWDVAGTTGNGINAANVDILLSYDAGFSYPVVLASNVPNDGSHSVTPPHGNGSSICRLMVKGSDNVFFDINDSFFTVNNLSVDEFAEQVFSIVPNPNNGEFTLSFDSHPTHKLTAKIFDLRGRIIESYDFEVNSGLEKTFKLNAPQAGIYFIQVSDGNKKATQKLIVK